MKRKIYKELVNWKNTELGRTALLIDGARRVGKSYIAEEFAKNEYKSYIMIDFNRASEDICICPIFIMLSYMKEKHYLF